MSYRKNSPLFFATSLLAASIAAADFAPGIDDITPIFQSTDDYIARTTMFDITDPDFTVITSLTAGNCTLTFSPAVEVRTAGVSWGPWGPPPNPRLLYSLGATSVEMTLNADCAAGTFGFEAEPNAFGARPMTSTYYSDEPLGEITRIVDAAAGPRLFAADSDTPITRVVFSSDSDLAVARIRFALPAGAILLGQVTDTDGTAIEGARVTAEGGDPVTRRSRTTDADGAYSMSLPHGTYNVTATASGYQPQTMLEIVASDKAPTEVDFALAGNRF